MQTRRMLSLFTMLNETRYLFVIDQTQVTIALWPRSQQQTVFMKHCHQLEGQNSWLALTILLRLVNCHSIPLLCKLSPLASSTCICGLLELCIWLVAHLWTESYMAAVPLYNDRTTAHSDALLETLAFAIVSRQASKYQQ